MPEADDNQNCKRCGRPNRSEKTSRITQWLNTCNCALLDQSDAIADDTINWCSICGKRVQEGRTGSLSQWIFRSNACTCKVDRNAQKIVASATPIASSESATKPVIDDEPELDLDPATFPKDRYKPISTIGVGGSSTVYLCIDRLLSKPVAVKCLRSVTAEQLVMFQQEAKATSQLNHPGIVKILDFGSTTSGAPYMVMEYMKGRSLEDHLEDVGTLTPSVVLDIFPSACSALEHAHSKGIFHRDIKPSNIFLLTDGTSIEDLRIIDFGVATNKQVGQEPTLYQGRTLAGTPAYMSPDQAKGMPYSAASEIYSIGCVLFEVLSGNPPFRGATPMEVISKHAHKDPPRLKNLIAPSPELEEISNLVSRCLSKQPEDRFANMAELKQALIALRGEPQLDEVPEESVAEPAPILPTESKPQSSIQLKLVVPLALSMLTLVSIVVLNTVQSNREITQPKPAPQATEKPAREENLEIPFLNTTQTRPAVKIDNRGAVRITDGTSSDLQYADEHNEIRYLTIAGFGIGAASLKNLRNASKIEELFVVGSEWDDKDLAELRALPNLTKLGIDTRGDLIGHGLKQLSKLRLTNLELRSPALTDQVFSLLEPFDRMDCLVFSNQSGRGFTGAGLLYMPSRALDSLGVFIPSHTTISQVGCHRAIEVMKPYLHSARIRDHAIILSSIEEKDVLRNLWWSETGAGDRNFHNQALKRVLEIGSLAQLSTVLNSTSIEVLNSPRKVRNIHQLILAKAGKTPLSTISRFLLNEPIEEFCCFGSLTREDLDLMLKMPHLKKLGLHDPNFDDRLLKNLSRSKLLELSILKSNLTESELVPTFGKMRTLKQLTLCSPELTVEGTRKLLHAVLPGCKIVLLDHNRIAKQVQF